MWYPRMQSLEGSTSSQEEAVNVEDLNVLDVEVQDLEVDAAENEDLKLGKWITENLSKSRKAEATGKNQKKRGKSAARDSTSGVSRRRRKTSFSKDKDEKRRRASNEGRKKRRLAVNEAFKHLQDVLPHVERTQPLTQVETLRLARYYIVELSNVICETLDETEHYVFKNLEEDSSEELNRNHQKPTTKRDGKHPLSEGQLFEN